MIVKIKKCVARIVRYEDDGETIKRVEEQFNITGQRISKASVMKQIPREAKLMEWGWVEESYEVDTDKLHDFLRANGKLIDA